MVEINKRTVARAKLSIPIMRRIALPDRQINHAKAVCGAQADRTSPRGAAPAPQADSRVRRPRQPSLNVFSRVQCGGAQGTRWNTPRIAAVGVYYYIHGPGPLDISRQRTASR